MNKKIEYSFIRYLAAKKTVDDRALNRPVLEALTRAFPRPLAETPLNILEIGAGIGTMLERMIEWELFTYAHYTAIDSSADNIAYAFQRLNQNVGGPGRATNQENGHLVITKGAIHAEVELLAIDLFDFIQRGRANHRWDLVIASAFLDLVDMPTALPLILSLCQPKGFFYFPINFDGLTILEPVIDPEFDKLVLDLYHRTMDERMTAGKRSGDSQTGRHLISHLSTLNAEILAAGSSDWVIYAGKKGYPADEAYFLHFIINTIDQALQGHPELEDDRFEDWVMKRHLQIERGELVYIAHQIDIAGKYPSDG